MQNKSIREFLVRICWLLIALGALNVIMAVVSYFASIAAGMHVWEYAIGRFRVFRSEGLINEAEFVLFDNGRFADVGSRAADYLVREPLQYVLMLGKGVAVFCVFVAIVLFLTALRIGVFVKRLQASSETDSKADSAANGMPS